MRVFVISLMLFWATTCVADMATVVEGTRVNLRSGRAETYRVIKSLEPGTQVEILHDENGYVHVKTEAGDVGWLPMRMLKIIPAPPPRGAPDPKVAQLQAELDKARAELAQNPETQTRASPLLLLGLGFGGICFGVLLGVGGLQVYYQKRLKGLRI